MYEEMFSRTKTVLFEKEIETHCLKFKCLLTNSSADYGGSPDVSRIYVTLETGASSITLFYYDKVDEDFNIEDVKSFFNNVVDSYNKLHEQFALGVCS